MRVRILLGIMLMMLYAGKASATHIVGGELEMSHVIATTYRFNLIIYFDAVNGDPRAIDANARIFIYSKRNNQLIQSILLPRVSDTPVNYTSPVCAIGQLQTRRILYSVAAILDPNRYTDPEGYYASYERCCRNGVINNIINPGASGQTFYMEFPPLLVNGQRFINSSPRLFPPLSDYACVSQPFVFNFAGSDPDGDQIVYSLRTPINGFSSQADPAPDRPNPGPYPNVSFLPGISVNNMVPGNLPLRVSQDGIISVTPSRTGLFVFAVVASEFRNGIKIGEVVREYQMLVIDCPNNSPPVARIADPTTPGRFLTDNDTIKFRLNDARRCTNLVVTDPNANTIITARVVPVNFNEPFNILPVNRGVIQQAGGTLSLQACFPECPRPGNMPYTMDIIVSDNGCAIPQSDTVRVNVLVIPEPNDPPVISASRGDFDSLRNEYTLRVNIGEPLNFDIIADDKERDRITLALQGIGFNPAALGMSFNPAAASTPPIRRNFSWTPPCNLLSADETEREYVLEFTSRDEKRCLQPGVSTTRVRIIVSNKNIANEKPLLSTSLRYNSTGRFYVDTVFVNDLLRFNINVNDPDQDSVRLSALGITRTLAQMGISFPSFVGATPFSRNLEWRPSCELAEGLAEGEARLFELELKAEDLDPCRNVRSDSTVKVKLYLKIRPNQAPRVLPQLTRDSVTGYYTDSVVVGREFTFVVNGTDPERDSIQIVLRGLGINPAQLGMNFPVVRGIAPQSGTFRWATDCRMLSNQNQGQDFFLEFVINDFNACGRQKMDTARVQIRLLPDPNPNRRPETSTDIQSGLQPGTRKFYVDTVEVGSLYRFKVLARDLDLDSLQLRGLARGFNFAAVGMQFSDKTGRPPLESELVWPTDCSLLPDLERGVFQRTFDMDFITTDFNVCKPSLSDTVSVRLVLRYRNEDNRPPVLSADFASIAPRRYFREINAGENVSFLIRANDADGDSLWIRALPQGFALANFNMQFNDARGRSPLTAPFNWATTCQMLAGSNQPRDFVIRFLVNDFRQCDINAYDTIELTLRLKPILNPSPPIISASLNFDSQRNVYFARVNPGVRLDFDILADDPDRDRISVEALPQGFALADFAMQFNDTEGIAPLRVPFTWQPTCEMLAQQNTFDITFTVTDNNPCGFAQTREINVRLELTDELRPDTFQPANVFTPNGDGINDTFTLPNLPPDNCSDEFLSIEIYNRWGQRVFRSNDRNFSWDGSNLPSGTFYYTLFFKKSQYKGTVVLLGASN